MGAIKGFKLAEPYDPPHQAQLKFIMEGELAETLDNERTLITRAKLTNYRVTGEPEFIVTTPQCVRNNTNELINSPGRLRVETADGRFSIEGEGFLWREANSSLVISNRVHTVIEAGLLDPEHPGSTNRSSNGGAGEVHVYSDHFTYDSEPGLGIYSGNVHVSGTNRDLAMTSALLRVKLPAQERQLHTITAETNVVIDYSGLHATGDRADYWVSNAIARITGHPTWRAAPREGSGDELVIDRTNKFFQANGNAWMKMPGASLGPTTFMLGTNTAVPSSPAAATNQFVEVWSERYEFHTNWGVFRDHVRVVERRGGEEFRQMTCGLLTVTLAGSNELQTLVADGDVVIDQETNRLAGGRAVYTATNGMLELTRKPYWRAGPREGRGDKLQIWRDQMLVSGNAMMRLPASELAESVSSGTNQPRSRPAAAQLAEIYSQDYTLRTNRAVFRGGIYATHPQMNLACERLEVELGTGGGKIVTAEQGVAFDLKDEHDQSMHGAGDKAIYTVRRAGNITNDVLRLIGNPALVQTSNTVGTASVLLLNRATGELVAPNGDYRIQGTGPSFGSNTFVLPKPKISK